MSLTSEQILNISLIYSIAEDAIAEDNNDPNTTAEDTVSTITNTNTSFDGVSVLNPYLSLITSEHQLPIFLQVVNMLTEGFWQNSVLMNSMSQLFNIQTAVGDQLDKLGEWIGIGRIVTIPLTGATFSFDTSGLGFDEGYWDNSFSGSTNSILDDSTYRRILLARIALNNWDGTINSAVAALSIAFPNNSVFIQDNQNMTMNVYFSGIMNPIDIALLTNHYFDFRPAGVNLLNYYYAAPKIFSWGMMETSALGGWGESSWAWKLV